MKNTIKIDVASFFQSDYQRLAWSTREDHSAGVSLQEDSITKKVDIREAVKDHVINITNAIAQKGDLIDFDISLAFSADVNEKHRKLFMEIFNDYNTRDEGT